MSTNIERIETVLLGSAVPLTGDQIVALTSVNKSSITSAINRLSQRRGDLVRMSHSGRSYYAIGHNKKEIPLEQLVLELPTDSIIDPIVAAAKSRPVRDRNGKFVRRDVTNCVNADRAGETAPLMPASVEAIDTAATNDKSPASCQSESIGAAIDSHIEKLEPHAMDRMLRNDVREIDPVEAHRKELAAAVIELSGDKVASVKRVLRSDISVQQPIKVAQITNPDLFRGWFNPLTGRAGEKLGLD